MKPPFILFVLGLLTSACHAGTGTFSLSSPTFKGTVPDDHLYNGYGVHGKNRSPALKWENPPKGTESFAVIMHDPDAPVSGGWWHWLLFDIPPSVLELKENAGSSKEKLAPKGSIQSVTSFGTSGYGGAAPPKGSAPHRYIITVYALDVKTLNLPEKTVPEKVTAAVTRHTLAKASITARYSR